MMLQNTGVPAQSSTLLAANVCMLKDKKTPQTGLESDHEKCIKSSMPYVTSGSEVVFL
jgi:hypothetical protein